VRDQINSDGSLIAFEKVPSVNVPWERCYLKRAIYVYNAELTTKSYVDKLKQKIDSPVKLKISQKQG